MRIHALECGRVQIKHAQVEGRGKGLARRLAPLWAREWTDWLPIYAYAIEHPAGVILVDSGGNWGLMKLPRWHPYFRTAVRFEIEPEMEIGPRLAAVGIGARDVKTIVLTHLHVDHDGGLAHFPTSKVLVAPGELAAASGFRGQLSGYLPQRWPRSFEPKSLALTNQAFGPFRRSASLVADGSVVAVATPGHTPDHFSVVVDLGDSWALIAGDATYTTANLVAGIVDGISPNDTQASSTLADIRAFASSRPTLVLPAHDPQSPARLAAWQARGGSQLQAVVSAG